MAASVYVVLERVTPERAYQLLDLNEHNRPVRDRTVKAFAEDMAAGRWNGHNGETIKIDVHNRLRDGQHRLWAITQADVPVDLLIAYNVPEDAQDTIDTGMKRKYSDVLHLRGESNSVGLASVIKRVWMWKQEREVPDRRNPTATTPQLDAVLKEHPELRDITKEAARLYDLSGKLIPVSNLGLLMWVFSRLGDDASDDTAFFFSRLADGVDLAEGNPILTLRKKLQEFKTTPARLNDRVMLAFVIKAWNAYRRGDQLKVIRFKSGGANPEPFPEPR